jgi:hypothetical protein
MTEETETHKCEICDRIFNSVDSLAMHKKVKHSENVKEREMVGHTTKKSKKGIIWIFVIAIVIIGIIWLISGVKTLPPTDLRGHIETNPTSHVLKETMPIAIQKHMLEHADGTGGSGVVINYNCEDYLCEKNIIENLETFSSNYSYVYVALFEGMDAKIALTKLNKIEILEEYDENMIKNFIEGF